ncbi:hypothetical protein KCP69_01870 [Salmonella enterica subsp. enterica]|nr:hypothetical protein KCP69_01870 [Salmonella enterica subsp. enterica]
MAGDAVTVICFAPRQPVAVITLLRGATSTNPPSASRVSSQSSVLIFHPHRGRRWCISPSFTGQAVACTKRKHQRHDLRR